MKLSKILFTRINTKPHLIWFVNSIVFSQRNENFNIKIVHLNTNAFILY